MPDANATQRFFSSLEKVSSEIAGADSAVSIAAKDAAQNPNPITFVRAQEELAQLPEDLRDTILSDLHSRMRNDVEAIWDNLPNSPKTRRRN
ncbi:hypothetical protein [Sedimentitalea todarodis]|uniref:Uncharacterized protein n=1 Tax=Sedimentitalea todarodis TaxID=1631240 RepID=A0ABU3VE49_9RHOB|nr:hypothetical protein [Sedimentitalea todarodis]MDU9004447.1 hypothetical protein [Sedimentitalea todarodis]